MGGQIVRRKKKGRPSKADLARRLAMAAGEAEPPAPEIRRSHRRRNARYGVIDFDDYLDDDDEEEEAEANDEEEEEDDEEDERRREKKLKLVVKLSAEARGGHAPARESEDEAEERSEEEDDAEDEEEGERSRRKKRRISGGDDEDENDVVYRDDDEDEEEEERARKVDSKRLDSVPGTPNEPRTGIPLIDKKMVELILDKLQKKDTYGVYAEPVDPEELPDYHDVIEHPMDFSTVRKKLADGSYTTLDQLESDVFLICSNAMQYNAPETIYHKQARAIQELGRKKFDKLRIKFEAAEKEMKLAQKLKTANSMVKKQIKKPLYRTPQETVCSDLSSGVAMAPVGEILNSFNPTQGAGCERASNNDGLVEGNSSLNDGYLEKAEETSSAKGVLSKLGRKPVILEDNRRASYNISSQPVVKPDSIFTTFESEIKQLVAVGLHAEYAYARSLARFAATLGPIAWRVASQRIEQALPAGFKFGRGWVGEYEPLPTPVLMLENHNQKQCGLVKRSNPVGETRKEDKAFKTPTPMKGKIDGPKSSEGRQSMFVPSRVPQLEAKLSAFSSPGPQSEAKPSAFISTGPPSEAKPSAFSSTGPPSEAKPSPFSSPRPQSEAMPSAFSSTVRKTANTPVNAFIQQQSAQQGNFPKPETIGAKQVESTTLPAANQNNTDLFAEQQFSRHSEAVASMKRNTAARQKNLPQSVPFKIPDSNGVSSGGLPNGKDTRNPQSHRITSPSNAGPNHMVSRGPAHFPHGPEPGVTDPVLLMKAMAEKTQKQQKPSEPPANETQKAMPSISSARREDTNNAAAAAARAWMSIGAGMFKPPTENPTPPKGQISADSLYNSARDSQSQVARIRGEFPMHQFQPDRNGFPVPAFFPQPVHFVNEATHFQNQAIMFPQLAAADLSRFQMQAPWRGLSPHAQPRQKQDTLPPDLNIGFQSPQSPVKQSSGAMVESQQPDLALQL